MTDATAVARREARRRRILENSQSRLHKISGKLETVDDVDFAHHPKEFSKDTGEFYDLCKDTSTTFTNQTIHNNVRDDSDMIDNFYLQRESKHGVKQPNDNTDTRYDLSGFGKRLMSTKLDIMLLSLFIQFLYVSGVEFIKQTYFFLPLFVLSVVKFYFLRHEFNNNGIVNTLLVMSGVQARNVFIYIKTIITFLEDVAIYLFTFILTQVIYVMFLDKSPVKK